MQQDTNSPSQIETESENLQIEGAKKTKYFLLFIVIVTFFIVFGFLLFASRKKNPQKILPTTYPTSYYVSPTITIHPTIFFENTQNRAQKQTILYVKQLTQGYQPDDKTFPTHMIYSINADGTHKTELFAIGNAGNPPQEFRYLPQIKSILINLSHSLVLYKLQTGQMETLFSGTSEKNYLLGGAVSPDGKVLVFNDSNAYTAQKNPVANTLLLYDLANHTTKKLFSGNAPQDFLGNFVPEFWSNNNTIYMGATVPSSAQVHFGTIDKNTTAITALREMEVKNKSSHEAAYTPDGKYYAFTTSSEQTLSWWCNQGQPQTIVKLFDTSLQKFTTIQSDQQYRYTIISWSPDNTRLLFSREKYKSGEGCEATFYPKEIQIYDVATQSTISISNRNDLKNIWKEKPIETTIQQGSEEKEILTADGIILDTAANRYASEMTYLGWYE